ncbi:hypothetical protein C8N43_0359 [Litoreibacter ponti]|uniref:Uncharacterized protein n=1 Tax=Litoreibacter ponti TaxID=1510457 RepID=A0A2T6BI28_9RHOB|nr:ABZJ_00895 family protein [Litoreibacter ponti]PTX55717.1 hypothetical protein C8N43_0359 [Litoreibacter ponti]
MTTAALLKRYAIVAAITLVALLILAIVLESYFGLEIGSGGSIVGALVPALDAGQNYARQTKSKPESGYMWKMAALFVPINAAIGAVLFLLIAAVFGGLGDIAAVFAELGFGITLVIVAVMFVIYWLAGRFFMGFGAKNELKLQEKLAAKKGE